MYLYFSRFILLTTFIVIAGFNVSYADLFISKCGGAKASGISLTAACKNHSGKTVVQCAKKCKKRKGLKCVQHTYELKKSKTCDINQGGNRNQLKTKNCTQSQIKTLESDFKDAKVRAQKTLNGIRSKLRGKHSKSVLKDLERAEKWSEKILKHLNSKVTLNCKEDKGMCKGANAHTVRWLGNGVRLCDGYFNCVNQNYRAAVIVHELAHKAGANDHVYYSSCNSGASAAPPTNTKKAWSTIAESYEYWARFGFCIPGKCPGK